MDILARISLTIRTDSGHLQFEICNQMGREFPSMFYIIVILIESVVKRKQQAIDCRCVKQNNINLKSLEGKESGLSKS